MENTNILKNSENFPRESLSLCNAKQGDKLSLGKFSNPDLKDDKPSSYFSVPAQHPISRPIQEDASLQTNTHSLEASQSNEKRKKGRPPKYTTDEERKNNIARQKKEWDERNIETRKKYYQNNKEHMNKMRSEHRRNVMKIYNLYIQGSLSNVTTNPESWD